MMTHAFRSPRRTVAWVGATALVGVLVGWPLGRLVQVVLTDPDGVRAAAASPGFGRAVAHTLETSFATTALAVPGGAALALLTARRALPGRRSLRAAIVLPLVVPPFVVGYSWIQAYGRAGLTDRWLGFAVPGLMGPVGIILVGAAMSMPISYFIVTAGLATREEPDLVRAARISGATGFTALRTVTLPLLRAPLGAAAVLIFVVSLESFAVPAALGTPAGYQTMTTRIYSDLALAGDPRSFTQAMTLALALVVLAGCTVWPADRLFRGGPRPARTNSPGVVSSGRPTVGDRLAAAAAWCYVALVVALPLLTLILAAVTPAVGVSASPANWTLENFRQALKGPTVTALRHSVLLAIVVAIVLAVLALFISVVESGRRSLALGTAVTLSFALPGSALAVGVMLAFGRYIGGTLTIIAIAYLAKLLPLAHRPLSAVMDRLDAADVRAARISGAGAATAWRTVVLPRLTPALAGATLLVGVTVIHELTISSLLYGPTSQTLAVAVLNAQELGDVGVTAALSVLMTALVVLVSMPFIAWLGAVRARTRVPRATAAPAIGLADVA